MLRLKLLFVRMKKALRLVALRPSEIGYYRLARKSGLFDATFYRGAHPALNRLYRLLPLNHFIVSGESMGLQPNPEFSPAAYLRLNPDVAASGMRPFRHYLTSGRREGRMGKTLPFESLPGFSAPVLRFDQTRPKARFAIVAHIYYPDLWPEFATRLAQLALGFDLFVTLTWRGEKTRSLQNRIKQQFPNATVLCQPNRGRDILPFVSLLNAGAFDGYEAVCKIHTKKSPHREDGEVWRRHLIDGVLPVGLLDQLITRFLQDRDAGIWVADGQAFRGREWWGSNRAKTAALLNRIEVDIGDAPLEFPAGSIYWAKPLVLGMLRALNLTEDDFELEQGQVDGTLAHAVERAIGAISRACGMHIRQTGELSGGVSAPDAAPLPLPHYVSAFYLPQFHPIAQNDQWWGKGYTEWRAALAATSQFAGHLQPMKPSDLGYYDLRAPEVLGQQAALARDAGIDAFCVYHYWFDPTRVLQSPLDNLLERPEIDFPFYLAWANESWKRNWDGLSGEVLLDQTYAAGFERRLVESTLPYMRDARYQRPDGTRPRFVIYRPDDMPDPVENIARMRRAWAEAGIGEVELGAVAFHIRGENPVSCDAVDFWIEMPPHGLVTGEDFIFGGPLGNQMGAIAPHARFTGLIYDYTRLVKRATSASYRRRLPPHTIAGVMPGWDNTARRGTAAHIAYGAHPGSFRIWLQALQRKRLATSYRHELFINAWNEWGEKAMLEPSERFGRLNLDVLAETTGSWAKVQESLRPDFADHCEPECIQQADSLARRAHG